MNKTELHTIPTRDLPQVDVLSHGQPMVCPIQDPFLPIYACLGGPPSATEAEGVMWGWCWC